MPHSCPRTCVRCKADLEPVQQLAFLVETDTLDEPAYLSVIRRLPTFKGRPVPVCKACQERINTTSPQPRAPSRSGVLATVGILSVGWLVHQLLLGQRV